jgi:VIT1/CCC1 family predicted Fe2+/Mn2+ transporter
MDGLVTNASLIVGVSGGGLSAHSVLVTGLAGIAAGSFSMATGEYVSVKSQNELTQAEAAIERDRLERFPEAEEEELAETLLEYGLDLDLAKHVASEISKRPEAAFRMHTREEFGLDPDDLASPWLAAGLSLVSFALGAIIPLIPYLAGGKGLLVPLIVFAVALFLGGEAVGRVTSRPMFLSGARQLALGAGAAAVTYGIGQAIHAWAR